MKRSKGFTLVELLVVIAIIGLLMMMLMPSLGRAQELARRTMCGTNLKTLGTNIALYRADYSDKFPLLADYGVPDEDIKDTFRGVDNIWDTAAPGTNGLTIGGNALQNVWILISKQGVQEGVLECPSDGDYTERVAPTGESLKKYGWITEKNFSYGMHSPYPHKTAGKLGENKAPLTQDRKGNFPIYADKIKANNGKTWVFWADASTYNKPANHPADGFNLVSFTGTVSFYKTETEETTANSQAGIAKDNIYAAGDDPTANPVKMPAGVQTGADMPATDTDCFIVPWREVP